MGLEHRAAPLRDNDRRAPSEEFVGDQDLVQTILRRGNEATDTRAEATRGSAPVLLNRTTTTVFGVTAFNCSR